MTRIAFSTRMQVIGSISQLRTALDERRRRGVPIALVPTMGALHEGHLQLVDQALRHAAVSVMSIFVNPLQFGPREDFGRYPRNVERDAELAKGRGVEILFLPSAEEMYARERVITITPGPLAHRWEGAVRPGHFTGVLTVVAKLFNIVQPQVAVFGQKDIQQVTLVKEMVRDLDFPVNVVVVPTVREADGLALSSRNAYLMPEERQQALVLVRALRALNSAFRRGVNTGRALESVGLQIIASVPAVRLDYLAVVDGRRMESVERAAPGDLAIVAARVGGTRLIDNIVLGSV